MPSKELNLTVTRWQFRDPKDGHILEWIGVKVAMGETWYDPLEDGMPSWANNAIA